MTTIWANRAQGKAWFQINWQTGAISEHWFVRTVLSYDEYADLDLLEQRVRELLADHKRDGEIAEILNTEGFRTARRQPFTSDAVCALRERWELRAAQENGSLPMQWDDGSYSVPGAAAALGVSRNTVYNWLRSGRLQGSQPAKRMPWHIPLTDKRIAALQAEGKYRPPAREAS